METEALEVRGVWPTKKQLANALRFLLGKWMYEGVEEEEIVQIWIISNWILENSRGDNFLGFSQLGLLLLMKDLGRYLRAGEPRSGMKMVPIDKINLKHIPDKHTYFGWKHGTDVQERLKRVRYLILKKRQYPPPKYVGVGYKDKGTRRNLAMDGSPDWRQVATFLRTETLEVVRSSITCPGDPRFLENAGTWDTLEVEL